MKTHNLVIYHCLACGAVMHCEPEQDVPQCCKRPMIKAAAESIGADEVPLAKKGAQPPAETPSLSECLQQKPR